MAASRARVYISMRTRRVIGAFLLAAFINAILYAWLVGIGRTATVAVYASLCILWALTVSKRVLAPTMRRLLVAGALTLVALFMLRVCRYEWVIGVAGSRLLWCLYYVPFTILPLVAFDVALCIGRAEAERPLRRARWLWVVCLVICAVYLTNPMHQFAFVETGPKSGDLEHGWFYVIEIAWFACLLVASFAVTVRRCRLSSYRRLWYVPVACAAVPLALIVLYMACGGRIVIGERSLLLIQELYALLFISLWESCIQIGFIPTNTDYGAILALSDMDVAVIGDDGARIAAAGHRPLAPDQLDAARNCAVMTGPALRTRSAKVPGGRVYFTEDLSQLLEANGRLEALTRDLEDENALLAEENRVRSEQVAVAMRSKLYDRIDASVRRQTARISELLDAQGATGDPDAGALAECLVLGAYVKRRANLELLAQEGDLLPLAELRLSMAESLSCLALKGVACAFDSRVQGEAEARWVIAAYDAFEAAVETLLDAPALSVALTGDGAAFAFELSGDALVGRMPALVSACTAAAGGCGRCETARYEDAASLKIGFASEEVTP